MPGCGMHCVPAWPLLHPYHAQEHKEYCPAPHRGHRCAGLSLSAALQVDGGDSTSHVGTATVVSTRALVINV